MTKTVVIGYARTPFGRYLGQLCRVPAVELGALTISESLQRSGLSPGEVDYAFMGMVVQAGAGQIPSRQATIKAGLPATVPSDTINKVCASGLRAANLGELLIRSAEASVVVAGGMENMSAVPYYMNRVRGGARMGDLSVVDGMVHDGLWCPFHDVHMGVHGSAVPAEHGITREAMDHWALRSHKRAIAAIDACRFDDEIVPVPLTASTLFTEDELPRRDTSYEKLAALPPAFEKEGLVTAGNAPAISDGAAALILASEQYAASRNIEPLAEIIAHGQVSLEPRYIATVPYAAAKVALDKTGFDTKNLDLIEINEAFAAVPLTCIKLGGWDEDIVNVNGGAVALGHPIGASGARILITLISELRRRGGGYGLATICSGAAQGEATLVKVG